MENLETRKGAEETEVERKRVWGYLGASSYRVSLVGRAYGQRARPDEGEGAGL